MTGSQQPDGPGAGDAGHRAEAPPSGPQAWLVGFSVRRPGIVLALALALAAYAILALGAARYDVFPEFAPPTVSVQTEAPGLNPEQVEVLVTQAVEGAISGLPGLGTLRSNSIQGLSVVTATFGPGSDILRARQLVNERLAGVAGRLPQGAGPPAMTALTSSTSSVLLIGLTSATRSAMDLRTVADWRVRLRLLAAPAWARCWSMAATSARSASRSVRRTSSATESASTTC